MRLFSFFILLLALYSCNTKNNENLSFEFHEILQSKKTESEKIKYIFSNNNFEITGLNEEDIQVLNAIYSEINNKPFWIKNKQLSTIGKTLLNEFKSMISFGLPQKRYRTIKKEANNVIKELVLTKNLLLIANDLSNGFFDDSLKKVNPLKYHENKKILYEISQLKNDKSVYKKVIELGKKDSTYQKLALELYFFTKKHDFKDSNWSVPNYKKDSLLSNKLSKKALFEKKYLLNENPDSVSYDLALKKFQYDNGLNPDGKIGQQTTVALNETNEYKAQRIALSLEKLRWKKHDYNNLILINIPENILRYYADDSLKSVNKIVVGKEDTQTPELRSIVYRIITLPYWTVPFSITSKEFLPILKKNPDYLVKNNMKLYQKEEEIDSYTVNWQKIKEKQFPYKVIQQPGTNNSLGIIKFEFNNKYGVYVHDTPSKSLFNTYVRAYSHGCMRCEKPVDLAKTILLKEKNNVIPDSLQALLDRQEHKAIYLKRRIPIIVEYVSVIVNGNNELILLYDIYKKDKAYIQKMFD
jgi:L,D-transpeptidase YcbB